MILTWHGQQLLLRSAEESDKAKIYSTWIRSYREQQTDMHRQAYYAGQRRRVDRLWRYTTVASSPDVQVSIHAWICGLPGTPALVHYVYVPPDLRGKGLMRALVRTLFGYDVEYTHRFPFENPPSGMRPNEYRLEDS